MAAIPFYKSVYGTHFLAGDSGRSCSLDHRAMAGDTVSYRLRKSNNCISLKEKNEYISDLFLASKSLPIGL